MSKTNFKGDPVILAGEFVSKGTKAPDFELVKDNLGTYKLIDGKGQHLILNIFPSLDTDVCASSVIKFNEIATSLPNSTVLSISKDLPFAQKRFCVNEGISNIIPLSDFRCDSDFGTKYGVLIKSGPLSGLLARSIVIIDPNGSVVYSELVSEITKEPDYDKVIEFMKQ